MTLEIRDLSCSSGTGKIVNSATLSGVEAGKLTALIGPGAAGKSTLFKAIAGLVKTRAGSIRLDGAELNERSRNYRVRQVCYLPQLFAANAALNVFDVMLLARKNRRGRKLADADIITVSRLLAEFGISHLGESYVCDLSRRQQQLVSIAQALAREPRVLLIDDPASALELHQQFEIMSAIRKATVNRDIICLVAMQDLSLAARFADCVASMRDGRIASGGDPVQVRASRPAATETSKVKLELIAGKQDQPHVSARR